MISIGEWNERIDAFIREENEQVGREVPVYRIYCQDDTDRSGGGIYNETVTEDTIGRFARALGDSNPLYTDPRYAAAALQRGAAQQTAPSALQDGAARQTAPSAFQSGAARRDAFPAPPLLECCICSTFIGGKLPRLRGVSVYDAGTKGERFVPIMAGDSFSAVTTWLGVREITRSNAVEITKPSAADRLLIRSHRIDLTNQRGEYVSRLTARSLIRCRCPVAEAESSTQRCEARGAANSEQGQGVSGALEHGERGAANGAQAAGRPHYTEEELARVYENLSAQYNGAFRRGAQARYWEDVVIGEKLPEEIIGPYDESDGQSLMAAIGVTNAFATKWGTLMRRRGSGVVDPQTGALRLPLDRHISDEIAQAQGLPRAIVSGIHSQALLAKSVSDWKGDAGFLRSLDCRCVKPLYYGDLSFQRGTVTGKYEEDGRHMVVLKMEAVRQDGVVHTSAEAVVELPPRAIFSPTAGSGSPAPARLG